MEIVLENPSVASLSTRTSTSSSNATATTLQLGLPMHHPPAHHFPHRAPHFDVDGTPLSTEDYYARTRHGLISSYDHDLDSSSAPVTVRRIDKSGLLEIADTDPAMCSRPRVLTGAEDVATRNTMSLRVDRSGLLEAVPEAVDQSEEHCNNGNTSIENETITTSTPVATTVNVTTKTFDEAKVVPRENTSKLGTDANPHVFDGTCCPLERPSSLEGQDCSDEVGAKGHFADIKVLTESPRTRYDVSMKATERLPHFSSFSPGPSLRHSRNDSSKGSSPLTNRYVDADSARLRNQKSTEFAAKYIPANSTPRIFTNRQSQDLTLASPAMRRQRAQTGCSRDNPTSINPDDPTIDANRAPRESLLAKGTPELREDDLPGEERAEAEGCEHTTVESLEEDEVSFKGSKKLLDNDNVQTLRVIILSEQL